MANHNYWKGVAGQRLSRRRALVAAGATSLGAAFLAACGGSDGGGSTGVAKEEASSKLITRPADTLKQAKKGGTLKLNHFQDVQGLDPGFANLPNETVKIFTYSWLMNYESGYMKAGENKVIPDIGESWEFSPDGLTLTVKVRQGVKWHNKAPVNGRALDVDDVVFSYDRLAAKGAPKGDIVNAANPNAPVLSFKAADRNTIVIKLKEPTSYITAIFAYATGVMPMLPKETDTTFDIRGDQLGTGPFVLEKYQPSVAFTYKRNQEYYKKDYPYVDQVDVPIVSEYAARLAQLKAGNIHALYGQSRVNAEDVLVTKKDVPELLIYEDDVAFTSLHTAFGWLPDGRSPWLDERVRQAYSMSIDREGFIDTRYNVTKFEKEGLPIETAWHTCINQSFRGYWMDPRDPKFGPNAKYFQHNIAEAKKLLAAAGHANGFDYASVYPEGTAYGAVFPKELEIIQGMTTEAGFRPKATPINYTAEFIPKYRDGRGQHEGVAYKIGPGYATDAIARFVYEIYSKGGSNFYGFSASGRNDQAGDPVIDALIDKGKAENDIPKRQAIALDIQREMAKKQWQVMWPGGAGSFLMAWPAVRDFQTYRDSANGSNFAPASRYWLDTEKPPFKKA
jgi:peptide/nickel transport system substrate-binding protein